MLIWPYVIESLVKIKIVNGTAVKKGSYLNSSFRNDQKR